MSTLLGRIIGFSLKNVWIVIGFTLLIVAMGVWSFLRTPIEAFPDVINTRVVLITQWPGRSAEEVEKFITIPIETEMNVVQDKSNLRSVSLFGLSVVTLLFEDGVDDFRARQMVANQLRNVVLPGGVEAEIQPPSGPTGEIYRYTLKGNGYSVRQLKEIQDWVIDKRLKAVPGIADVISFGGEVKTYEVTLLPDRLSEFNLVVGDVSTALAQNNGNVGGDIFPQGEQAFVVRGIGAVKSIADIENTIVDVKNGTPIFIRHVATVRESARPRLGKVGRDDVPDAVEGIVLLRKHENPSEVLKALNQTISDLNARVLPDGVEIDAFYDRTKLVRLTTHTVMENLIVGMLLVTFILTIFLLNWRTTLIVSLIIPLALLFAFICMHLRGMSANLLSIGAIDFGIIIDGAVVMVEGIFVYLAHKGQTMGLDRFNAMSKDGLLRKVSVNLGKPIFFSKLIIITALLPIFTFQKVEGKMFSPLAWTMGFALLGALLFTLTLVPLLAKLLLKRNVVEKENRLVRAVERGYEPVLKWALNNPGRTLWISVGLLLGSFGFATQLGTEFLPQLNEGSVYVRASMPQSISFEEASQNAEEMRRVLMDFPEVNSVISQNGRPNDGTDPTGFFNAEFFVDLKDKGEWRDGMDKVLLVDSLKNKLESKYAGVTFGFSQPISDNVQEAVSGVKGEMAIKVYGEDLTVLEEKAEQILTIMKAIEGVEDLGVFKSIGQPELRIELDFTKLGRYGVNVSDANDVIEMALGGKAVSTKYENERRFDIRVRYDEEYRTSIDDIGRLLVPCSKGTQEHANRIPLREIATISQVNGTAFVYRESNLRFIPIKFSVRGRDLGSTIAEAQSKVNEQVQLDKGYQLAWNGEFENQVRAVNQLKVVVPISILLIFLWLFIMFGSSLDAGIVLMNVPFALIGGIMGLWATGVNFSISAGVGFIALFGVCVQNGVILVSVFNELRAEGHDILSAILEGARSRVRPIVMTALMAGLGLLPAALSTGIGSETQKPLAIVVIAGLISATVLTLIVMPVIYKTLKRDVQ